MTLFSKLVFGWSRIGLMKPGSILVGPGRGLRFDPGPSNPDYARGNNELPVQNALVQHLRAGDVFYDVGANVGFMSVIGARLVGSSGGVYAFEPVPANGTYIRRNAEANAFPQLVVVEKAISNRSGKGMLNLAKYSGGSALASVEGPPDPNGSMQVDLVTVDELVECQGFRPPQLVKIDVEGAELEVLEGMLHTVERYRPVVVLEFDAPDARGMRAKQAACEHWLRSRAYVYSELADSYHGCEWFVKHVVAVPAASGPAG